MTTSLHMPDVQVEIAFNAGYSTPSADRVWTDVSEWLELGDRGGPIGIVFGRQNERSTADANTLDLTLDNSDGRFTAGLSSSPYFPNVKLGRPIRVTATPVGGTPSVRFVGFVDGWPVSWAGGSAEHAVAEISATSRLARLGYDSELRSVIEESILVDNPTAYYPLGEAEGATSAADGSGAGALPMTLAGSGAPVVFGQATGPGTDDLTAATFAAGQYLYAGTPLTGAGTIEFFMAHSAAVTTSEALLTGSGWAIWIGSSGQVAASNNLSSGVPLTFIASPASLNDGAVHHIALTLDYPNTTLYVDGEFADLEGVGYLPAIGFDRVGGAATYFAPLNGSMSHVAAFADALTAGQIADHASAGLTGFVGEAAGARILRYASWAGIPAGEVEAAAATISVAHVDSTGAKVVDLMRAVEIAEAGAAVLHDDRGGILTLVGRDSRTDPATITLDFARQEIGGGFTSVYNRDFVINDASASNSAGTVTARVINQPSHDDLGPMTTSIETIATDSSEPYRAASWAVNVNAEPCARTPSLSVDLLTFSVAPSQNDILDATVGTLLVVDNQPSQAPTSTGRYFVEGYSETIGPESYTLAFNVSPGEPYTNFVIFDDAARGFDSGAVFAY